MKSRIAWKERIRRVAVGIAGLAVAQAVLAAGAAAHPVLGGFQGTWTTTDCAASGGGVDPDCERWGDGSILTMQIGFGRSPRVGIRDSFATDCIAGGASNARWNGSGTGWYTQDVAPDGTPGPIYLHVVLTRAGCGGFETLGDLGRDLPPDAVELEFYHDLGGDAIWFDPDGVNGGLDWIRTN